MSIVDELKKLIIARNGSIAGVSTIADAVKVLVALEDGDPTGAMTIAEGVHAMWEKEGGPGENPLKALVVIGDFEATTEQLLGKSLSDLQTSVEIDMDTCTMTGTLKYVTGYTGFSGDEELQKGHYLAIKADVDDVSGVTYTINTGKGDVELDSDQILIWRVDERYPSTPLEVTASKTGFAPVKRTFNISGLTLAPQT